MGEASRMAEALQYAAQVHARQRIKGGDRPYLAHVLGVASITMYYGGNEDEAIGALLHDALEDADDSAPVRETIRERFGEAVLRIVEECTDTEEHPKPAWRERKERHLAAMRHAGESTLLVYAADKLQNARAILQDLRVKENDLWDRFNGGKAGTFWYYRAMIDLFRERGVNVELADEIVRTVNAAELLAYSVASPQ